MCEVRTPKRNRLGNVAQRTVYNGVTYDSKIEAEWAAILTLEERGGMIHAWYRQATLSLGPDFKTRVDFLVFTASGVCHVDEVKGKETERFKTVRRLWLKYGPCEMRVRTKRSKSWHCEVIPGKQGE